MDLHVQAYKQIHQHLLHCHRKYYQGFISIRLTVAFIARGFFFPANARVHRFSTAKITLCDVSYKLLRIVMFAGVNWLLYCRIGPLYTRNRVWQRIVQGTTNCRVNSSEKYCEGQTNSMIRKLARGRWFVYAES